jgi:ferredoxin
MRVRADLDLCQGHQNCQAEAPTVFGFDEATDTVVVRDEHPHQYGRQALSTAVK